MGLHNWKSGRSQTSNKLFSFFNVHILSEKDWKLPRWRDQFVLQVKQDHRARWVRWLDYRILDGELKSVDLQKQNFDWGPKSDYNQVYKSPRYLHWSQIWPTGGTAEYAATCDSMLYSLQVEATNKCTQ